MGRLTELEVEVNRALRGPETQSVDDIVVVAGNRVVIGHSENDLEEMKFAYVEINPNTAISYQSIEEFRCPLASQSDQFVKLLLYYHRNLTDTQNCEWISSSST